MKRSRRTASYGANLQRGSVLVFAVVLLALLALISAGILFTVRQGVRVSQNAAQSVEANLAADAGIAHATKVLRDTITTHAIFTPEGVFSYDPAQALLPDTHPWLRSTEGLTGMAPWVSPLKFFADTNPPVEPDTSLKFSVDPALLEFGYTSSLMYANTRDSDEYALRNEVFGYTSTFYKDSDNVNASVFKTRTLPRLSGSRGAYYVWISDLDSKLYAKSVDLLGNSDGWALNVKRTLPDTDYSTHYVGATDEELWKEVLCDQALKFNFDDGVREYSLGDATLMGDMFNLETGLHNSDARFPHYHSLNEMLTQLPSLYVDTETTPVTFGVNYEEWRADLDFHFTVYKDVTNNNSLIAQKFIKDASSAININTASIEVIAAALCQIPGENDFTDPDNHAPIGYDRALAIAKRIVSKRPFLCRMDFEDFLAAHLRGAYDVANSTVNLNYVPLAGDCQTPSEMQLPLITSGEIPIVRAIYYGLSRRWGKGYIPNSDPSVNPPNAITADTSFFDDPLNLNRGELSLSQFLEIPGIPNQAIQFKATLPVIGDSWPNEPAHQKARFDFFYNDTQGTVITPPTVPLRTEALISPREFNNIVNSVTGIFENDDEQTTALGQPTGGMPVVSAGVDQQLNTTPQGDDVVGRRIFSGPNAVLNSVPLVGDDLIVGGTILPGLNGVLDTPVKDDDELKVTDIFAGPNGVADTWISRNRPSFYSYIDDMHFLVPYWNDMDLSLSPPTLPNSSFDVAHLLDPRLASITTPPATATTIPQADRQAARVSRFYYRNPLIPGTPAPPTPPSIGEARLEHLVSWRCLPTGSVKVSPQNFSDKRAGYYQMAFDDWTVLASTTTYVHGPMQCAGNPDTYFGTIDDSDIAQCLYSAAKPWSGANLGNPIDIDNDGIITTGVEDGLGNGDVSWGPKFAFRSRFFSVYVLGQGVAAPEIIGKPVTFQNLKSQGEKRIEAVYDALLDQIIWQRSPITDKRALGEPAP